MTTPYKSSDTPPVPAYLPSPGSILHPPTALYARVAATASTPHARVPLSTVVIPPRSGAA